MRPAISMLVAVGFALAACDSDGAATTRGAGGDSASAGTQSTSGTNAIGSSANGAGTTSASTGGGGRSDCKRGIATNTPPSAAFSGGIGWWYDWSPKGAATPNIEFTPMIWGEKDLGKAPPPGSKFLLGFNEPNFHAQSDLTPAEAAAHWPELEASGLPLVSPAMNFCGPADQCNGTNPYQYLKDFFAACAGCKVDYVAVHWYNCDLPSLKDYLEPGGNLEGFEQFGKPIWLTEFSCTSDKSVSEQQAYMEQAIPYLEANAHVLRYAWFSAGPIPSAQLMESDGTPTALGKVYAALDSTCQP
ncbi:MAG: glycoside hydrolase family protein [Polyangiaceae bacterium]